MKSRAEIDIGALLVDENRNRSLLSEGVFEILRNSNPIQISRIVHIGGMCRRADIIRVAIASQQAWLLIDQRHYAPADVSACTICCET